MRLYRFSSKTLNFNLTLQKLRETLEQLSAVEVAELFLSPHIHPKVFNEATQEPGPTMWIVNRSDVSTKTLEILLKHSITGIAERAAEKLKSRKATITHLTAPLLEEDMSRLEAYAIEDILGHPLCPWEAMLFFAIHPEDDVRASTCLSLARRLWEHPAQSLDFPLIEAQFKDVFSVIAAEDISPMVRAYAARIPMWKGFEVDAFLEGEANPHVQAKWLQHENSTPNNFQVIADSAEDPYLRRVLALDSRLVPELRKQILDSSKDPIEILLHEAYLSLEGVTH